MGTLSGSVKTQPFDDADLVRVTHDLVAIPSVSRDEGHAARWFAEALSRRGFRSHVDEVGNALGVIGEGDVTVALVGHLDTVPGDLPVRVEDGVLHGRGSVDAKGPLVTLAAAAARAAAGGARARFVVVGCVEEEVPSSKGAKHLLRGAAPAALIVGEPSRWDGVTLGYKGHVAAELTLERDSAHGAHDVESAPEAACALWAKIARDARSFAPEDATLFDRLMARLLSMDSSSDGTRDRARLRVALRLPEALPPEEAGEWLRSRADDGAATARLLGGVRAWRGPRTSPVARAFGRAILARGSRPRFQVKTGTADLNVLAPAWGCPAVAYGPGDAALDHTPIEHLELDDLCRAASTLSDVLLQLSQ